MNQLLQVKLRFSNETNSQRPGGRNLRKYAETSVEKIDKICEDLRTILRFYKNSPKYLEKVLVDVNYTDIIAKSNRIKALLKPQGKSTNEIVVGARFSDAPEGQENHIITYYLDEQTIMNTIDNLRIVRLYINEKLNGKATTQNFNEPNNTNGNA